MSVAPHDYVRSRATADSMIARWGNTVLLRRSGLADRRARAGIMQYTAAERMGRVLNPLDLHCVFSALDPDSGEPLATPPTDTDVVVTLAVDPATGRLTTPEQEDQKYRIVAPVIPGVAPSGLVLYWDATVRKY